METGVQSWTGEGVGTGRASFLEKISSQLPEYSAEELANAVVCALQAQLSDGTARHLFEQLTPDTRELFASCRLHEGGARHVDRDDFYLDVANHLNVEPERVRLILHVVFAALHSQTTERLSESVASELPDSLSNTWVAARHGVPLPR